jgi:hypothetical protein
MSETTNETADKGSGNFDADPNLGKFARDKVTGFEGIITIKSTYLFGCDSYTLSPKAKDGKVEDAKTFDKGRIEIISEGVRPSEVRGDKPGGDFSVNLERYA